MVAKPSISSAITDSSCTTRAIGSILSLLCGLRTSSSNVAYESVSNKLKTAWKVGMYSRGMVTVSEDDSLHSRAISTPFFEDPSDSCVRDNFVLSSVEHVNRGSWGLVRVRTRRKRCVRGTPQSSVHIANPSHRL